MREYVWGMLTIACASVGLIFLRYWRVSGDRLFGYFAAAFAAMAIEWAVLAAVPRGLPARQFVYLIRLLAFVLIIVGIIEKNRAARRA
jgi:hypothetical protein